MRNGEGLVNTIFKSLVGAAALVGAMASTASAQDYTWTLQNFEFGAFVVPPTGNQNTTAVDLTGNDIGTASGSITLRRNSANNYSLVSYSFTTTSSTATQLASGVTYTRGISGSPTDGVVTEVGNAFKNWVELFDNGAGSPSPTSYRFRLTWATDALWNEMETAPTIGDTVSLLFAGSTGVALTREYRTTLGNHAQRAIDDCNDNTECVTGSLRLSSITNVPEPASMAVLGAGLLGLYAARRRRRA